jgi:hypothetical protein
MRQPSCSYGWLKTAVRLLGREIPKGTQYAVKGEPCQSFDVDSDVGRAVGWAAAAVSGGKALPRR